MTCSTVFSWLLLAIVVSSSVASDPCPHDQGPVRFCRCDGDRLVIRAPNHIKSLTLARIQSGLVGNVTRLDSDQLEQRRTNSTNSSECIGEGETNTTRLIDVHDLGFENGTWVALCAEYERIDDLPEAVRKRWIPDWAESDLLINRTSDDSSLTKNATCSRCTVLSSSQIDNIVRLSWPKGKRSPQITVLNEAPFDMITVHGRIIDSKNHTVDRKFDRDVRPGQTVDIGGSKEESKGSKESKESKESKSGESKETKETKETNNSKESKNPKGSNESKEPKESNLSKELKSKGAIIDVIPKGKDGEKLTVGDSDLILYDYDKTVYGGLARNRNSYYDEWVDEEWLSYSWQSSG